MDFVFYFSSNWLFPLKYFLGIFPPNGRNEFTRQCQINSSIKHSPAFSMTVEFWTTITFEAWLLITALLLAGNGSENYRPLFFCYSTSVREPTGNTDFCIFKILSFCITPVGCTTKRVDKVKRELPQTCVPCWRTRRRGWRRRCRTRTGGCDCTTGSHAQSSHSRAAGNTENSHSTQWQVLWDVGNSRE